MKRPKGFALRDDSLPVGVSSARVLVELGRELGIPGQRLLQDSGVHLQQLTDPFGEIGRGQELVIIGNLVRECEGSMPGLGIEAGRRYHLAMHEFWGFVLLTSRTLREATEAGIRYIDLVWAFTEIEFACVGKSAITAYRDDSLPAEIRAFVVERNVAASRVLHRETLGFDLPYATVSFRHAAPPDVSRYIDCLGVEPEFGAAENMFRYDACYLETPIPQANPLANARYERACRELAVRRRRRTGVAGSVRIALASCLDKGIPDAAEVAAELQMSLRTLSRKLKDEGTSFRALVDEVREHVAEEMLGTMRMPAAQVAHRLGYQDAASFSRAFKRWTGVNPQAFRDNPRVLAAVAS